MPPVRLTRNFVQKPSTAYLFVLDDLEENLLLDHKTKFLPTVELPDSSFATYSSTSTALKNYTPADIAHRLLKLDNLIFQKILEVRIRLDNIIDYVLFYQETELPITTKPIYEWIKVSQLTSNFNCTFAPELPTLYLAYKTEKRHAEQMLRISSRRSPRPLSPNTLGSTLPVNGTLNDDMINDDSCGELFLDSPIKTRSSSQETSLQPPNTLHDSPANTTANVSFILPSTPLWQRNRTETSHLTNSHATPARSVIRSPFPNPPRNPFAEEYQNFTPKNFDYTTVLDLYVITAFPSLYLSKDKFISLLESHNAKLTLNVENGYNRLFTAFNVELVGTSYLSYTDFCNFIYLTSPKTVHTGESAKQRAYVIARLYCHRLHIDKDGMKASSQPAKETIRTKTRSLTKHNSQTEKCTISDKGINDANMKLTIPDLLKMLTQSIPDILTEKTLTTKPITTHPTEAQIKLLDNKFGIINVSSQPSLSLSDFIECACKTKFKESTQLLRLDQDILLEETKKRTLSEGDSDELTDAQNKRVRFDSDSFSFTSSTAAISPRALSPNISTLPPAVSTSFKKPKIKYRIAQHCVTCGIDGRIEHNRTELVYEIGRNIENSLQGIAIGPNSDEENEPDNHKDSAAVPLQVAKKMFKKAQNVKAVMDAQQNTSEGRDEKNVARLFAERQLSTASYKHFESVLSYNNINSAAYQLLEGLRYFERRQKVNDKPTFTWDSEVNMDSFGQCAISVCRAAKHILSEEDPCLKLESPCYVLGDIHGNYKNLYRYEQSLFKMGLAINTNKFLFLGDYVDRGQHGLEVVLFLFAQKVLAREKIFLIRGNHELRAVQKYFTFHNEVLKKFGNKLGEVLWREINKTFDHLPLAAVVDDQIFCAHGGIPRPSLLSKSETTTIYEEFSAKIDTPYTDIETQCPLAWDLLWSDPQRPQDTVLSTAEERDKMEDDELRLAQYDLLKSGWDESNIGFGPNPRRGTAAVFNETALTNFLKRFGLSQVIRAHEVQSSGFKVHMDEKLLTVFSSANYCNSWNDSACILIHQKVLRFIRMVTADSQAREMMK